MEILSVTLKNFKSHSDRHFIFQPGTNAICGENGAGKTSILEAIAWTLFNYRGAYKNEDLVRNGSASAQVSVELVSSRDYRTYRVSRCTRAGYTIYDPQLGEKLDYSRIEEEVLPWLRQQLGVSPGTDLADLFANTIGVPQGMFTADFLKPDRERKRTFDTILKVDEYRKVFENLLPLSKYAEVAIRKLETEMAHYDEELQGADTLQQKRQAQSQEIQQVQTQLQQLQTQLASLKQEQDQLSTQASQMLQLETRLEKLQTQLGSQIASIERLKANLQQAEQAVAICTNHREAYQAFLQAEQTLQSLEQERQTEQKLQRQQRQWEKQLGDRQTQLATLTHQLAQLTAASDEIERLQPLVQYQAELEQEQQNLNQQLQTCLSLRQTLSNEEKRLQKIHTEVAKLVQEVERLRALAAAVQQIPVLEQQQQRLQQQLSRIEAATQFEADLRQIVEQAQEQGDRHLAQVEHAEATLRDLQQTVPLWADALAGALATLGSGADWQQQLLSRLQEILADLAQQTSKTQLEKHLKQAQSALRTARQQEAEFANLERLQTQQQALEQEALDLQASLATLQAQLAAEPVLQSQQTALATALKDLEDPRGRSRLLQQELQRQPTLQAKVEELQGSTADGKRAIAELETQLASFADLPDRIQAQQALKDQHREPYEEYLAYRELANTRKAKQQQLDEVNAQIQTLEQEATKVTEERDRLRQTFDPVQFQAVQTAYQTANNQHIALSARLPDMQKYLADLEQQLAKLEVLQTKRAAVQTQLIEKRRVEKFIKFARKAYKEAGPRITERYIQSISRESDKLFRELLNRPNVGLEWTRDYEIVVQEGAHTRRFVNLSGGEQMCAALAVRLALLKVLADIDIAFFDEPTTNMDRPRREQLAEAIANIKTFRQLFVISHDDTFEQITENIIVVEREQ